MGNSLSNEEIQERNNYINKLLGLDFPILDLSSRYGSTGYIDFIEPTELGLNNVMMGKDGYYDIDGNYNLCRPFFVFKAELEYPNGIKKQIFTTFFQRYTDMINLWHCCSHYGPILMHTEGGASTAQIKMLYELLVSGEYKLTRDKINEFRLNYHLDNTFNHEDDEIDESKIPINIRLGYTY